MTTPQNSGAAEYWRRNLRLLATLLAIWFLVNALDSIPFFGFKLGFWFAQQGSIYVFVILIFVYVAKMNKLDREFDVHED